MQRCKCAISLEEIERENIIKLPDVNEYCNRKNLQEWLKIKKINPITNKEISTSWINKHYIYGLNYIYK